MDIKIKRVKKGDFIRLYTFWEKVGLKLYSYEEEKARFESMLTLNPNLSFMLIDKDRNIIGSILGAFDGRSASIHRLAIEPSLQKKKYGSYLLKHLEEKFKILGIKKVSSQIHISNKGVLNFYKKLGYKKMNYALTIYKDL